MLDTNNVWSFCNELIKIAEVLHTTPAQLKSTLLPHQQRVVDRMQKQRGLVVAHGLGSGKTFSSIAAGVKLSPDKIVVAVPASLKENYRKEIAKHVEGDLPVEIESLQRAATRGELGESDMLIVDEAHRARNTSSKTFGVLRDSTAAKRMLLTASPVYNRPEDIAPLVNIAAGEKVLPTGTDFEKKYIKKPGEGAFALMPWVSNNPKVVKKKELGGLLNSWVDKHMEQGGDFPEHSEKRISVPMSKKQTKLHQMAWGELPLLVRMRMKKGLPPSKKDLQEINKFESQARQVSNSLKPFAQEGEEVSITPKLTTAFGNLKNKADVNPKHKALVYSNYLSSLDDYGKMLDEEKIPYAKFTGQQKAKERKQIVEDYNAGKFKALLVSSAAGEGLDLKGTRQVQVLEPHWNEEKIKQVVGRAIRHGSHAHLPEKDRHVEVEKYETYPKGLLGKKTGVEQWLYDMSDQKERLNRQVLDLIQSDKMKVSVDLSRTSGKDAVEFKEKYPDVLMNPRSNVVVATDKGSVVGGAVLYPRVEGYHKKISDKYVQGQKPEKTLKFLQVDESERGKGIGGKLLQEVLKNEGRVFLGTDNTGKETDPAAVHLYKRHGFSPVREEKKSTFWVNK